MIVDYGLAGSWLFLTVGFMAVCCAVLWGTAATAFPVTRYSLHKCMVLASTLIWVWLLADYKLATTQLLSMRTYQRMHMCGCLPSLGTGEAALFLPCPVKVSIISLNIFASEFVNTHWISCQSVQQLWPCSALTEWCGGKTRTGIPLALPLHCSPAPTIL